MIKAFFNGMQDCSGLLSGAASRLGRAASMRVSADIE
ncbi:hypothetical protein HCH_02660 [Hahella chejuensis KCTC 2396]|uniref:Uncharacterized protein n=1 Tax=Hahella chejuensis (strain KCTC 2396) TaxID=349521 RepID=Q2SIS5_HAHCH|nr:hypothetical protein HCH_02660 [Hahella chejuensis KCTC 2396]